MSNRYLKETAILVSDTMNYLDKLNSIVHWIAEQPNEDAALVTQRARWITFQHSGEIHNLVAMIRELKVMDASELPRQGKKATSSNRPENKSVEETFGTTPKVEKNLNLPKTKQRSDKVPCRSVVCSCP